MKEDIQAQIVGKLDSLHRKVDSIEAGMVVKSEFRSLETKVDNLEVKVSNVETKVGNLAGKVDSLEDKVGDMVTRDEFHTAMDEVLVIVRRLDQERLFTTEWIRRIESDVERVKKHLHLA